MIGAGNVAHHLAPAILKAGMNLCQIYSRSIESARELGMKTGISYTADVFAIYPDCDIYIFCVSDDALLSLYKSIRIKKDAIVLHTSGSLPMEVFKGNARRYGVLYPLQTFSKRRSLEFFEIPLCIEASDKSTFTVLKKLAEELSGNVREMNSATRKKMHLAAVFANNFTNHLFGMAGKILEEEGLEFALLRPLIFETAHKVMLMSPEDAQTGPARRGDDGIIDAHTLLLKHNKKLRTIYTLMSDSIREMYTKPDAGTETDDKQMTLTLW